jgi:hypothetical protein
LELSKVLFWDTDFQNINWETKARYVIERVVMYGTVADWRAIKEFYGIEKIRSEMLQSNNLDAKSLSFLSCVFNVPESQFKCYSQIQSRQGHWSY